MIVLDKQMQRIQITQQCYNDTKAEDCQENPSNSIGSFPGYHWMHQKFIC